MQALTIGKLERVSGVPRGTIYYYVRAGLLPPAQKSSPSRALYAEEHVALLKEIQRLKEQGLPLATIKELLAPRLEAAHDNGVDLVARKTEQTRRAILMAATRRFAREGYKGTRIADVIGELGITPQVLYAHFATKRDLFAACYGVAVKSMADYMEPRLKDEPDPAVHLLWRMYADSGIQAFAPDLIALSREAALENEEARTELRATFETFLRGAIDDLRRLRRPGAEPPFSDELVSYAFFGAFQHLAMRASWDAEFSRRDVLWTALGLFLAFEAVYSGELDIEAWRERYGPLLDTIVSLPPPIPPAFRP